jgi:hypothetical protein
MHDRQARSWIGWRLLLTQYLDDLGSVPDESFSVCPAIYQEYVPGNRHIRLNCFGDQPTRP